MVWSDNSGKRIYNHPAGRLKENEKKVLVSLYETLIMVDRHRRNLKKLKYYVASKDPYKFSIVIDELVNLEEIKAYLEI